MPSYICKCFSCEVMYMRSEDEADEEKLEEEEKDMTEDEDIDEVSGLP